MQLDLYHEWLDRIADWARAHPAVIGLVAVGSTAGTSHPADEHSDHDLFVVTKDGHAGALRTDLSWLPDSHRIVMVHVETEHGRGVVYDDGHLIEMAVFDDSELELGKVNAYRLVVGGTDIADRLAAMALTTASSTAGRDPAGSHRFHAFVGHLIVGLSRYARGERISANHRIRSMATAELTSLLTDLVPAQRPDLVDNLDAHRRFEQAYPVIGGRLADALDAPLPHAARGLLAIAEEELAGRVPSATPEVFAAVRAVAERTSARASPPT